MLASKAMPPVVERGSTARRPRVGDLVEIRTTAGLGYLQYVSRDTALGPQVRVLPGTFKERPDLAALARQKALYYVHFPLGAAVSRGLVSIVGDAPLPEPEASMLRPENDLFRIQEIWNDALLAERIVNGWRPV